MTFADGTPFNASVAKFNYDRILTYGYEYLDTSGTYPPVSLYDYSEVIDENTFRIHFNEGWLFDMAHMIAATHNMILAHFISPEDVDPAWDIRGTLKPEKALNGLGPYYVDENESILNEKIVLKKRQSWRDDYDYHTPKLDKIVLVWITDPHVAVLALEKGDIDYINRRWNAPLDSLTELERNSRIAIESKPDAAMYFLRTAWWKEPFNGADGILLRKAICYAMNRAEMTEGVFNGYALPATDSMYLCPLKADVPSCCAKGYDYNIEEAKQLLTEAGWRDTDGDGILDKDGKALKDLDFVISSSTSLIWQKDLALVVQSQLKEIGIDAEIHSMESGAFSEASKSGDFDLQLAYNVGWLETATRDLHLFNRKSLSGNVLGKDYYRDQNEILEAAVENADLALSIEEHDQNICQACDILYEEAGTIPLVYPIQYAVMNSKVKGFEFGPSVSSAYDHVEECWIEG